MSFKPTIGVTGPNRGGTAAWWMTWLALRRAGARPVRIQPARPLDESLLDGLVIGGGSDIEPVHYGQQPDPLGSPASEHVSWRDWLFNLLIFSLRWLFRIKSSAGYDPDRDHLEKHLIQYALINKLPVLGICRGAQLLNVVMGGSLHQSIDQFYTEAANPRSVLPRKKITITENSQLYSMLGCQRCTVNALHDQAIDKLAPGAVATARDDMQVIQAIEVPEETYLLGVQWHPEYLPQSQRQLALFRRLVHAAAQRKS